jgi:hypothetical protein
MQSRAMKKIEIDKKLSLIPEDKIDEINDFIEFILSKSQIQRQRPVNLRGIWKEKGFEKIKDIESELKEIRRDLTDSVLKRKRMGR